MRAIGLIFAISLLFAPNALAGQTGGDAGGSTSGNSTISSWAIGASGGGVRPPSGTSIQQCTPWTKYSFTDPAFSGAVSGATTRTLPNGEIETLHVRNCAGRLQYVWVGQYSARQVAQLAFQRVVDRLPDPQPQFAPPANAMIVNFDTWFGVTPTGNIAATASVPGLSSTVTARPTKIVLDTGSKVIGDVTTVQCSLWGSTSAPRNGCVWTPRWPSTARVTGTDDQTYPAVVRLTWAVSWRATNGQTGNLGELTTTTAVPITVREIQTDAP